MNDEPLSGPWTPLCEPLNYSVTHGSAPLIMKVVPRIKPKHRLMAQSGPLEGQIWPMDPTLGTPVLEHL